MGTVPEEKKFLVDDKISIYIGIVLLVPIVIAITIVLINIAIHQFGGYFKVGIIPWLLVSFFSIKFGHDSFKKKQSVKVFYRDSLLYGISLTAGMFVLIFLLNVLFGVSVP